MARLITVVCPYSNGLQYSCHVLERIVHGQVSWGRVMPRDWAQFFISVVTGASDGIGREFALQLGEAGFNVVLVARNQTSLQRLATEIGTEFLSYPR